MKSSIELVRDRFQGKTMALIGGDRRDKHAARLRREFGLANVVWIETRDTDASSRRFESMIKRGEVALVVLLHGLIRHQHASDARRLCKEASIPLVPYWRSPHPQGLADAILRSAA